MIQMLLMIHEMVTTKYYDTDLWVPEVFPFLRFRDDWVAGELCEAFPVQTEHHRYHGQ